MHKALIETTGRFGLIDISGGQTVRSRRPNVVIYTHFLQQRFAIKQIRVLCSTLKEEATDEQFVAYLKESDGDVELATKSFLAAFDAEYSGEIERAPARRKPPAAAKAGEG
jgi:hypothetical protein